MQAVAFLRGMNVGGHRITNADLAKAFSALGFEGVATYRASGNVMFDGDATEATGKRIATGLEAALGYPVPTLLRSGAEVAELAGMQPFSDGQLASSKGKIQVMLLAEDPSEPLRTEILGMLPADEAIAFRDRALVWLPAAGILDSDFDWVGVQRLLGVTTTRTQGTLQGLAKKLTPR